MKPISVVMLDDDDFLLKALKRTMLRMYPTASIETFSELTPFWDYIRQHDRIDLIISDYLMPHMHGLDVLERCTEENAYPVRALLTGDMTLATMMRQPNVVHAYLAKPFNAPDVFSLFEAVADLNGLSFAPSVRRSLGGMTSFPVSGPLLQQLKKLIEQDDTDLHDLAAVVSKEPVIVAKVLQLANSAYLGFQRKTSSIDEAIARLGTKMLMAIISAMAISKNFQQCLPADVHQRQLDIASHYACCVKAFAKHCGLARDAQEDLFATALLSFVGKMILLASGSSEQNVHDKAVLQEGVADYQLISAYVMRLWGYSAEMCHLIIQSHNLTTSVNDDLSPQHMILFVVKQILFKQKAPAAIQALCEGKAISRTFCSKIIEFAWDPITQSA